MSDLILAILCAWRLTQLLAWDDLLSPVTCWLANKHRLLDELFGCPHCMGFWCSLITVVAVSQDHWLIRMGVWAFAVSGAVSMIQHATGWLDTEVLLEAPGTKLTAEKAERVIAAAKKTWDASVKRHQQESHDREPAAYSGLSDDTIIRLVKADGHLAGPAPYSRPSTAEIIRRAAAEGYVYKGGYNPKEEGE